MDPDQLHQFQSALERLRACIHSRNDDVVEELLMELDLATIESGEWPVGFFDGLEELLTDQNFLTLTNSWKPLYFIDNNWEQLSEQERERLKKLVVHTFDKHADWMGAFVSSEILGEHYADESTLATLTQLANVASLPARALAPHGIEYLAKTTQQESLRTLAVRQLQELRQNDSEQVRQEALISLARLDSKAG
jgi:hypothetical protein